MNSYIQRVVLTHPEAFIVPSHNKENTTCKSKLSDSLLTSITLAPAEPTLTCQEQTIEEIKQ
jgi:hypothetical protein